MNYDSPSKSDVKHLVATDQWHMLGILFGFTPVYHEGFSKFIDWRCVPASLMLVLQEKVAKVATMEAKKSPPKPKCNIKRGDRLNSSRAELHKFQGGVCHYCKQRFGLYEWSIDHRMPYARGGKNVAQNRIGCCKPCNNHKGPLTEEEFISLKPGEPGIVERCKAMIKKNHFNFFPRKMTLIEIHTLK
jgi:hypothetical protein